MHLCRGFITTMFGPINMNQLFFILIAASLMASLVYGFTKMWRRFKIQILWMPLVLNVLTSLLSPTLIGLTCWNGPAKGSNWNPIIVIAPLLITACLFSYSLITFTNGRYRILAALSIFISGVATYIESLFTIYIFLSY